MPRIGTMEESEAKKVHDIDGYLVETDSMVRLLTGLVIGEVPKFEKKYSKFILIDRQLSLT